MAIKTWLRFAGTENSPHHVIDRANRWIETMHAKVKIWGDFVLVGLNYSYDQEWHVHRVVISFETNFPRREWAKAEGEEKLEGILTC